MNYGFSRADVMSGRECKRANKTFSNVSESGRFCGYASVFGVADMSNDIVERGAFSKTLELHASRPVKMLFQHDPDQVIGKWSQILEDERGLFVEGQLTLSVDRAKDIHLLMLSGALDGLSIGFKTRKSKTDANSGARRILEADLWEISVVTFPMLPDARVSEVKAQSNDRNAIEKALARKLRDAADRLSEL